MTTAKIVLFDLETCDLAANKGHILCGSWTELGSKYVYTRRIDQYPIYKKELWNDEQLVLDLKADLEEADILVGHYSTRFDLPYLNSRLLKYGHSPVAPTAHVDTWRIARNRLRLQSNRLATLIEFLGVETQKTQLDVSEWKKAEYGVKSSLDYVVEHCEKDVIALEEVYLKIRSICPDHPNVNLARAIDDKNPVCSVCGSSRVHRRGTIPAKSRFSYRYQCQDCGHWDRGKPQKVPHVFED